MNRVAKNIANMKDQNFVEAFIDEQGMDKLFDLLDNSCGEDDEEVVCAIVNVIRSLFLHSKAIVHMDQIE